jgi:16S rRNA G966 N2-methylase RsmD
MGVLMAARMLGYQAGSRHSPEASLNDVQRRALMIADNKIAENAGWDENLLRQELQSLEGEDFNLALLGFGEDELDELLGDDESEGLTDENAAPEVPEKPVSVLGDVWICGDHKILCGDSTLIDSYQTLLGEELADMVFTDPPYNVNYANSMPRQDARQIPPDPE